MFKDCIETLVLRTVSHGMLGTRSSAGQSRHLIQTRDMVMNWGCSAALQRAALCHSLYTGLNGTTVASLASPRQRARNVIGRDAERLTFLYGIISYVDLLRTIVRSPPFSSQSMLSMACSGAGDVTTVSISGADAKDLLVIRLASTLERRISQTHELEPWLYRMAQVVRLFEEKYPGSLPSSLGALSALSETAETHAIDDYLAGTSATTGPDEALEKLASAARQLPFVADINIRLAWMWGRAGDRRQQREVALLALTQLKTSCFICDTRLKPGEWSAIATEMGKGRLPELNSFPSDRYDRRGIAASERVSGMQAISRFDLYLTGLHEMQGECTSGRYPGLRSSPTWPSHKFTLADTLEKNYEKIRDEADNLALSRFHRETENIARIGDWSVYLLLEAGRWRDDNLERLPTLARILREDQDVRLAGGLAYLSRFLPGTVIKPHTGPTNMRLRLHFALQIPTGDCGLRVGGHELRWQAGNCLVFDDYFPHEAWNRTDKERLVLIVDVWHPDLAIEERHKLEVIHRMSQIHGRGLFEYWKHNHLRAMDSDEMNSPHVDDLVI
jgi:hypothetical protein